jgi:hypothetical protein
MSALKAYDEVIDFIAATNPEKVLAFPLSEVAMQHLADLTYLERITGLSPEKKAKLDHYMWLGL